MISPRRIARSALLRLTSWFLAACASAPGAREARAADFTRDVRPILVERCVSCHDQQRAESGLRLDEREAALRGGDHGALLVPGNPESSLLIQVVTGAHRDIRRMPRKGDPLSEGEVASLRAWIAAGAAWPDTDARLGAGKSAHWAFAPPSRPPLPSPRDWRTGVGSPVDLFIRARWDAEGLSGSPPADRVTLLRRLSLDLTGLPPTLEEVEAFLADESPDAYARAVERLLASPHYGERWGRHWLDAARYADSDGFEKDKPRFIWFYRDWVVDALNSDMPYDQFIVEQIAGDLLPDATQSQRVATGFLRNAMLNEEGGVDPEQFRMEGLFDRMDAIGKSILGLTIQCAQCHDHKFDPLSQKEYFELFAFLNNDHEASMVAYTREEQARIAELQEKMRAVDEEIRRRAPDWEERMTAWEAGLDLKDDWTVVRAVNAGDNGTRYYYYDDGSIRAASYAPTQWTAVFKGTNHLTSIAAFRVEQLTDPNLPCGGPGRSIRGMSALSEFKVTAQDAANPATRVEVKFVRATADYSNPEKGLEPEFQSESRKRGGGDKRVYGPVAWAIDGNADTAWGIDAGPGRRNVDREAVFIPEKPIEFPNGAILTFHLQQNHGGDNSDDNQNHNLGRWRISVSGNSNATANPIPKRVREILGKPREDRTAEERDAVFQAWRATVPEFAELNARIESLWAQWPEGAPTLTLMTRQGRGPGDELRTARILRRGDWLQPGEVVEPATPAFLHAFPEDAPRNRLGLARWLVDPRSPTTARTLVNRVWQRYFGTGLVETSEDLGTQAPEASHPELLDWLAVEFMSPTVSFPGAPPPRPWSLKHLHRLILHSATYQQSSQAPDDSWARDPQNRLLTRGPRFRLEAEIIRDVALAASGLLNPELGGPPVYPPAPGFLFRPPASYGPKVWNEDFGPNRYRRAIYTFRYRSVPYPVLQTFDAPNGDFSCVRRARSNTPLQALTTLNETLFVEAARALARRMIEEGGETDEARIEHAFRLVLSRRPLPAETRELLGLLERQRQRIAEGWVDPRQLATGRAELPANLPDGVTPTQFAAYTVVGRALLNLDEAITKE